MKTKLLSLLFCVVFAFACIINASGADTSSFRQAQTTATNITDFMINSGGYTDIQSWIDNDLTQNVQLSEWYIFALRNDDTLDFSQYKSALEDYVANNEINSAVSRQKYALLLHALGSEGVFISMTADKTIGTQGIMSYVFGLHLLNNGIPSENHTTESVIQNLLDLQLADGGWAVMGDKSDIDVTAMVLQSLALHYQTDENVKTSVDSALACLSGLQNDNAGFSSYGVPNTESISQVIIALSLLDIDIAQDSRFVKNGKTVFDAIEAFALASGGFCHQSGGEYNANATVQMLCAMRAYVQMHNNSGSFYLFADDSQSETEQNDTSQTQITTKITTTAKIETITTTTTTQTQNSTQHNSEFGCKPIAVGVIIAVCVLICLALYIAKKRSIKNYLAVLAVALLAVLLVIFTDIKSADDYYNGKSQIKENAVGTVTMSIDCITVADKLDSEYIPSDGVILKTAEFDIEKGDSVYDILIEASRQYNIQVENNGSENMAYISGINYLYEFDFGDLSGWIFFVNGKEASEGCDMYELSDGDVIEWRYTQNLGDDLR